MIVKKVSLMPGFLEPVEKVQPDGPLTLTSAVGDGFPPRCRNLPNEVKKIQIALNRFSPVEGGPLEKLKVDGIAGRFTKEAIRHFQRKFDLKTPDGKKVDDAIVDVDGPTIRQLRAGPDVLNPDPPSFFLTQIPRVIEIITAAQAALSLAQAKLDLPNPLSDGGTAVEKHFHPRGDAEKRSTISLAQLVYTRILTAIGHIPFGRVIAVDEPPKTEVRAFMFTFFGGFNLPFDPAINGPPLLEGLPVDRIYVTPKGRTLPTEQFQYAMIHELSHFVGSGGGIPDIDDHAYFHKERAKYDRLSNFLATRNADTYARFAFEAIGKGDLPLSL